MMSISGGFGVYRRLAQQRAQWSRSLAETL
jgi:hypothetical protein